MELTKDQSIVLQVAAKIASDLAVNNPERRDIDGMVADWASSLQTVYEVLAEMHGWQQIVSPMQQAQPAPQITHAEGVANVMQAFPTATVIQEDTSYTPPAPQAAAVRIKGKQHGPIPEWLIKDAAEAGVREVWDNRDGLAVNPKRPHFKDANGDKAFWPPKGRAA